MSNNRKGQLMASGEWAKHLRRAKKFFWRRHRLIEKRVVKRETMERANG
jgi:hypothetical protein